MTDPRSAPQGETAGGRKQFSAKGAPGQPLPPLTATPEPLTVTDEAGREAFKRVTRYWPPEWVQSDDHIDKMLEAVARASASSESGTTLTAREWEILLRLAEGGMRVLEEPDPQARREWAVVEKVRRLAGGAPE
jgi:hypothetical protein